MRLPGSGRFLRQGRGRAVGHLSSSAKGILSLPCSKIIAQAEEDRSYFAQWKLEDLTSKEVKKSTQILGIEAEDCEVPGAK